MCDEWKSYVDDPRNICKYGSKCYQKNPQHHTTYKHPPHIKKDNRGKRFRFSPYSRDEKQTNSDSIATDTRKLDKLYKKPEEESNTSNSVKQAAEDKNVERETNSTINLKQDESSLAENEYSNNPQKEKLSVIHQDNLTFYDPGTSNSVLKELFLVEMPSDFFKLYDCLNINNSFENTLSSVNLEPIGPYDLLLGKLPILSDKELYLSHWRFFYDPPELQVAS